MALIGYTGKRNIQSEVTNKVDPIFGTCDVFVDNNRPLRPVLLAPDRRNFEWGNSHERSLSWNLAQSIMRDYFEVHDITDELPEFLVRRFYEDVVLNFDFKDWSISVDQLKSYFTRIYAEVYPENETS